MKQKGSSVKMTYTRKVHIFDDQHRKFFIPASEQSQLPGETELSQSPAE